MATRLGACRCSEVQFQVTGEPVRVAICPCIDCRHESGSAFTYYGIWPSADFQRPRTLQFTKVEGFAANTVRGSLHSTKMRLR